MYTCWLWDCYDDSEPPVIEEPFGAGIMTILTVLIIAVIAFLLDMFLPISPPPA